MGKNGCNAEKLAAQEQEQQVHEENEKNETVYITHYEKYCVHDGSSVRLSHDPGKMILVSESFLVRIFLFCSFLLHFFQIAHFFSCGTHRCQEVEKVAVLQLVVLWKKIEQLLRNLDLDLCLQQTHFIVVSCKWSTKFLYTLFVGDLHMITTGLTRLCLKDNRQMRVMFVCRYCEFEFFYFLMNLLLSGAHVTYLSRRRCRTVLQRHHIVSWCGERDQGRSYVSIFSSATTTRSSSVLACKLRVWWYILLSNVKCWQCKAPNMSSTLIPLEFPMLMAYSGSYICRRCIMYQVWMQCQKICAGNLDWNSATWVSSLKST